MKPKITREEIDRLIAAKKYLCFVYAGAAMIQATFGLFSNYPETTIWTAVFTIYFIVCLYDQVKWYQRALTYKEEVYGGK